MARTLAGSSSDLFESIAHCGSIQIVGCCFDAVPQAWTAADSDLSRIYTFFIRVGDSPMNKSILFIAAMALALSACGDNKQAADAKAAADKAAAAAKEAADKAATAAKDAGTAAVQAGASAGAAAKDAGQAAMDSAKASVDAAKDSAMKSTAPAPAPAPAPADTTKK